MKAPLLKSIIESGQLDPGLNEQAKEALAEEDPEAAAEIKRDEEAGDVEMLKAAVEEKKAELEGSVERAKEIAAKIPEAQGAATEAEAAMAEVEAAAEQVAAAEDLEVAQEAKAVFDEAAAKVEAACTECKSAVPGYEEEAAEDVEDPEGGNSEVAAPAQNGLAAWANKTADGVV